MASSSPSLPSRTLAVCGFKSSGKTTLLVEVVGELRKRGLSVGVVKTDVHGIRWDAEGTDSERLFEAGAEVVLYGPGEVTRRRRRETADASTSLETIAGRLELRHDLVLIEGGKSSAFPKVWLARPDESEKPAAERVGLVLSWSQQRVPAFLDHLESWLAGAWEATPMAGGILAGGASRRMGRPKETLEVAGETLLRRTGRLLATRLSPVVRLGGEGGPLPSVPDPPGLAGPAAGMVAAVRWLPEAGWVFVACDQPRFDLEALDWLLSHRRPGVWAVLPQLEDVSQPLCAFYEPMMAAALEDLARSGRPAPSRLAGLGRVHAPEVPRRLADAFRSANDPGEWVRLTGSESS